MLQSALIICVAFAGPTPVCFSQTGELRTGHNTSDAASAVLSRGRTASLAVLNYCSEAQPSLRAVTLPLLVQSQVCVLREGFL